MMKHCTFRAWDRVILQEKTVKILGSFINQLISLYERNQILANVLNREIDGIVNTDITANIKFMDTYLKSLLHSIDYHFLTMTSQTNQIDKPEWMTQYLLDIIQYNIAIIVHLKLTVEYENTVISYMIDTLNGKIYVRFQQDYEELINSDPHYYIHFIEVIANYEFDLIQRLLHNTKLINYKSKIFENMLKKKEDSVDKLIKIELENFDTFIFKVYYYIT